MANIFLATPGTVAIFTEDYALPSKISFTDSENKAIMISGVDNKQSVDAQFQTSMERDIYDYVFGDHMGDITIQGRAYFPCVERGDSEYGHSGYNDLMDIYSRNRMSKSKDTVKVTIGDRSTNGYMTDMLVKAVGLSDEPSGLVYDFGINIKALPDDSDPGYP